MNCTYQLERGTKGLTYCSFRYDVHLDTFSPLKMISRRLQRNRLELGKTGEVILCRLPDIIPRDWLKDPMPKSSRHSHSEKKLQGTVSLLVEGKKVSLSN